MGKRRLSAHLVSLLLGGDTPVVDHLGWQEVELDIRVEDPRLAPDEPTCFQVGRGSIPWGWTRNKLGQVGSPSTIAFNFSYLSSLQLCLSSDSGL